MTDTSGNVVDRYGHDAWGTLTSSSESVPQRLRYAGYWYDQEFGWYWVSVRYDDPPLGRWLAPDPSQQDGVRTYVYVGDDPVDATDPTGLGSCPTASDLCQDAEALGGLLAGAGAAAYALYQGGSKIATFAYEGGKYVITQVWTAYTADDTYTGPSPNPACDATPGQVSMTCPTPDSQTNTLAPSPIVVAHSYQPPPKTLPGFPDAKSAKANTPYPGGLRKRWEDADGNIYEWNYQHGGSKSTTRRGAISVNSTQIRVSKRNREIRVVEWRNKMDRWLMVYNDHDDSLVAEYRLRNIGIDVMQSLWHRPDDDPMPAVYPVEEWMMPTLRRYMDSAINFDGQRFSYFVEVFREYPGQEIDVTAQSRG